MKKRATLVRLTLYSRIKITIYNMRCTANNAHVLVCITSSDYDESQRCTDSLMARVPCINNSVFTWIFAIARSGGSC